MYFDLPPVYATEDVPKDQKVMVNVKNLGKVTFFLVKRHSSKTSLVWLATKGDKNYRVKRPEDETIDSLSVDNISQSRWEFDAKLQGIKLVEMAALLKGERFYEFIDSLEVFSPYPEGFSERLESGNLTRDDDRFMEAEREKVPILNEYPAERRKIIFMKLRSNFTDNTHFLDNLEFENMKKEKEKTDFFSSDCVFKSMKKRSMKYQDEPFLFVEPHESNSRTRNLLIDNREVNWSIENNIKSSTWLARIVVEEDNEIPCLILLPQGNCVKMSFDDISLSYWEVYDNVSPVVLLLTKAKYVRDLKTEFVKDEEEPNSKLSFFSSVVISKILKKLMPVYEDQPVFADQYEKVDGRTSNYDGFELRWKIEMNDEDRIWAISAFDEQNDCEVPCRVFTSAGTPIIMTFEDVGNFEWEIDTESRPITVFLYQPMYKVDYESFFEDQSKKEAEHSKRMFFFSCEGIYKSLRRSDKKIMKDEEAGPISKSNDAINSMNSVTKTQMKALNKDKACISLTLLGLFLFLLFLVTTPLFFSNKRVTKGT